MIGVYLAPLFVAQVLIGISTLMFNRNVLGIPGNLESAIVAKTHMCTSPRTKPSPPVSISGHPTWHRQ